MSRRVPLPRDDLSQHNHHSDHPYSDENAKLESAAEEPAEQTEEEKAAAAARKTRMLAISFVLMILFSLGNKVTQLIQLEPMQNYILFLSVLTTFIYIPISFIYIVPVFYIKPKDTHREQRAIPMKTWIIIGCLDAIAGIVQSVLIAIIAKSSKVLVVLLSQTAIPISMMCSSYFLKAKYSKFHYVGVSIVLTGLLIVLLPRFLIKSEPEPDAPSPVKLILSIILFVLANIPQCLSTVYKELALGEIDVDPMYLNGWVAVWQFVSSIILLIPTSWALHKVGDESGVPIKDLPLNLYRGAKCWLGYNSYVAPPTEAMLALGALYYAGQGIAVATNQLKTLQKEINSTKLGELHPEDTQPIAITSLATANETFVAPAEYNSDYFALDSFTSPFASTFATKPASLKGAPKSDDCAKAPIYTNSYMAFNVVYNILIILLIKYGSANLFFLSMTITLPLSSVIFSLNLPFIKNPKPFTKWDVMGLIVLLSGIVIYRFWKPISALIWGAPPTDTAEEADGLLNNTQTSDNYTDYDQGNINSSYQSPYDKPLENEQPPYYGEVHANVDDPFGDQEAPDNHDGYETAEVAAQFTTSSSNASDTTNHGRKKVKKGRK